MSPPNGTYSNFCPFFIRHRAGLAQSAERGANNATVGGSSPSFRSAISSYTACSRLLFAPFCSARRGWHAPVRTKMKGRRAAGLGARGGGGGGGGVNPPRLGPPWRLFSGHFPPGPLFGGGRICQNWRPRRPRPSAWLRACGPGRWAPGRVAFGPTVNTTPKNGEMKMTFRLFVSISLVGKWARARLAPGCGSVRPPAGGGVYAQNGPCGGTGAFDTTVSRNPAAGVLVNRFYRSIAHNCIMHTALGATSAYHKHNKPPGQQQHRPPRPPDGGGADCDCAREQTRVGL